jgi:hypothetical protein
MAETHQGYVTGLIQQTLIDVLLDGLFVLLITYW